MLRFLRASLLLSLSLSFAAPAALALDRSLFREARSKEREGPRDPHFDAAFDRAARGLRPTADPLGVDDLILLRALKAIAARKIGSGPDGAATRTRGGLTPTGAFALARAQIGAALVERLGLEAAVAGALADEIASQALKAARARGVGGLVLAPLAARQAAARGAMASVWETSRIDRAFEVPYIAGYDRDEGDYVFIDCALPTRIRRAGRAIPVGPLLTLHERVEKAMLQSFSLTYPSAHQIALRIEKAAAEAAGAPWRPYDDYITQVSTRIFARREAHPSDRLDLQPYLTFEDADNLALVRRMEAGVLPHASRADPKRGPDQPPDAVCPPSGLSPVR
jgi:hypothetical protein